ncbi:MAG: hypothetical protein AUI61_01480 [Thaumarchaeota archaeon 13_1_40CM_2_39_13_2]|nr:MAG: hypothetical protein AUI61_01480 [Thaumarchaeota archaeon 13_1_40CM_2_39_13_2]
MEILQSKHGDASEESINNGKKLKQIVEILGLLEETHRTKSWILQEIKKEGLMMPIKPTMNSYDMLCCCKTDFIRKILSFLKGEDIDNLEETQVHTKIYHWFFTDIVAGSNPSIPTRSQVRKIVILNELISKTTPFRDRDTRSTIVLPTGDGMAIGFGDSPERPIQLAIDLHKALFGYNQTRRGKDKLLIRIGIESGPVYFVKDLEGKDNVWGPGIILTRRVMDMTGDGQIFAASRIAEELLKRSPRYKEVLHPVQNYETRYGEKLQLYNVYGEGFGCNSAPRKAKIATTNLQRGAKTSSNFSFNQIEVLLEVTDQNNMQTHHTWIWDIVNISKEPKSRIFYYLDGQVPKDIADLHITVTNENNDRLEIGDITINKPYRKEFYVILDKPVLPKQRKKLKLQYDWEEPDRVFLYKFPSGAKKFNYTCTVPKEIDLKNRVLKVDIGTGYRIHASPPATVKHLENKNVILWGRPNIISQDAYEFHW